MIEQAFLKIIFRKRKKNKLDEFFIQSILTATLTIVHT